MAEEKQIGSLKRIVLWLDGFAFRHLPAIIYVACFSIAIGQGLLWFGLDRSIDKLIRLGSVLSIVSVITLGSALKIVADDRRRLTRFVQAVRDYAVENIEPLRDSIAALHDVDSEKPPTEVPRRNDVSEEKPLGTKERNTLLVLVAVLCKEAKIDTSRTAKAAGTILGLADAQGIRIGESTIESILKRLPDAVANRSR